MPEADKEKLFKAAQETPGIQAADIAYYCLLFFPLITGTVGFCLWATAILYRPEIPESRLNPLLYVSCVLMGLPVAGGYLKNGQ